MVFGHGTSSILKKRLLMRRLRRALRVVGSLVVLAGFAYAFYYLVQGSRLPGNSDVGADTSIHGDSLGQEFIAEVTAAIDKGNYDIARARIRERLRTNPDDYEAKNLRSFLMDSLEIDFKFNYLPDRRQKVTTRSASSDAVLTAEDPYYLIIHSSDQCYLYVFQLGSSDQLARLFPDPMYVPILNPVPGGPMRIPDGYEWFYLDNTAGNETIFLVASRWRQKALEMLCSQLELEDNTTKNRRIVAEILASIEREGEAAKDVPGLVFAKYQFRHSEVP